MPNLPETIVVMLAASSIGAIFSSASPDFGVQGVLDRFGQIEPKVLVAVDGYYYNGKVVDCLDRLAAITEGLPSVKNTS
jgi:acetoacetyl-CoA synthetase